MIKVLTIYVKVYDIQEVDSLIDVMIKVHRAFDLILPNHEVKTTVDDIIEVLQSQQREVRHAQKHKRVGAQKALSFPE